MDPQAETIKETFEKIWGPKGTYRNGSSGERYVERFLKIVELHGNQIEALNDYGAGTGLAAVKFFKRGIPVHMTDIATNALSQEAIDLLNEDTFTWTQATLWDLPINFPYSDWGYCVSVLQAIPKDKLDDALHGLFLTCEKLFVSVIGWQETYFGIDVHPIVKPGRWWTDRLCRFWPVVKPIPNPEDKRRYDFICLA